MCVGPRACALLLVGALTLGTAAAAPNVVLFLADDLGWRDTGVYGSTFHETPRIDALATNGLRFTHAYAHPVCSPSRCMLMAGQYNARFNHWRAATSASEPYLPTNVTPYKAWSFPEERGYLPDEVRTLAEALHDAGYQTWLLGKSHLGTSPLGQGFDLFVPHVSGLDGDGLGHFAPWPASITNYFVPPYCSPPQPGDYMADKLTEIAVNQIRRRGDAPFFLFVSHYAVHTPLQAKGDVVQHFQDKLAGGTGGLQTNPVYAAMVASLDQSLGVILDELAAQDILTNTIVIFASDNGGLEENRASTAYLAPGYTQTNSLGIVAPTDNAPLRGGKDSVREGGVRVPLIISWPGVTPAHQVVDTPVHLVDLYPTLLDWTPATAAPTQVLDGVSLAPLCTGGALPSRSIIGHYPSRDGDRGSFIVRDAYKLILHYGEGQDARTAVELYDLAGDVEETNNCAGLHPDVTERLLQELVATLGACGGLVPVPNPDYNGRAENDPEPSYEQWATSRIPEEAARAIGGDPDADGWANLWEYAAARDPTNAATAEGEPWQFSAAEGQAVIYAALAAARTGVICRVETSPDLITWQPATQEWTYIAQFADRDLLRTTIPAAPRQHFRLHVGQE